MAVVNPKNIDVGFDELQTIIHISDIHIRLYQRHKEYRQVFETLYKDIKDQSYKNAIIVVSGDVLHAKTDLSPEAINLASEFLTDLSGIHPTFVTIGNHDLNLANSYRLDALTPILKNIASPNLYYLRDSGVYRIADTDIAIFSIIGDSEQWPSPSDCTAFNKIAILHAPVNDSQTDTGYTITSRHVDVSTFDGYDYVLLGDIHRRQILQERDAKNNKPLIAYCGSLIQQNHGENLEGHGWLEWDMRKGLITEHDTHNDYGYATITVDSDGLLPDLSSIPPRARLRVFVKDLDPSKVKKIESILKKKFHLQELTINKMRGGNLTIGNQNFAEQIIDVQNIDVQNKLIEDYLSRHYAIPGGEILTRVFEINDKLNSRLQPEDFSRNIHWKPVRFEFDNILSYGEGNVIDFETMSGIYGLFGPNASGKTAAFDALTFCLFDKTPRAFKGSHIMNNRKNTFRANLQFEINGVEYGVERIGKRRGDNVKVDVEFWKMESAGRVSLNAEDRRSTNAVIRKYVGTYEDFILTSFSVQNNNALFIDKSQSERKDLLSQFMGINVFDELYTTALDEMKENKGALRILKRTDISTDLTSTQNEIESLSKEYKESNEAVWIKRAEDEKLDTKILELYGEKVPLPPIESDIHTLESRQVNLANDIAHKCEKIIELDENISDISTKLNGLTDYVEYHEDNEIEEQYTKYQELQIDVERDRVFIETMESSIQQDSQHRDHLAAQDFDPNCEFCIKNNTKQMKKLVELGKSITKKTEGVEETRIRYLDMAQQFELMIGIEYDYLSYIRSKEECIETERQLLLLQARISELKMKLEQKKTKQVRTEEQIKQYYELIDSIARNAEIDELIEDYQQNQATVQSEIKTIESHLKSLHGKLQVQKSHKIDLLKKIEQMEEIEQDLRAYEYYVEAVKRNGIPYELISKIIPSIEAEINNILSQIADFTISLEVDGKNINGRISYGDDRHWPLELSSGMERFVSSLAIRVALITVSNLPKPNFLIIDEGFGTLTSENLMSMHMLFSILKNQFDFIAIISHLDSVRDMVDGLIEIEVVEGFSRINY